MDTVDSSETGSVTGETTKAEKTDDTKWLQHMATMMQQQEEEAQTLTKLIQDLEDGKSAVIRSNQDSQLQMGMQQQLI